MHVSPVKAGFHNTGEGDHSAFITRAGYKISHSGAASPDQREYLAGSQIKNTHGRIVVVEHSHAAIIHGKDTLIAGNEDVRSQHPCGEPLLDDVIHEV